MRCLISHYGNFFFVRQLYGLDKKFLKTPLGTKVIKIVVLRKFSENNFDLSDAEDNISGPSNRGGKLDLHLLRTLLATQHASYKPIF